MSLETLEQIGCLWRLHGTSDNPGYLNVDGLGVLHRERVRAWQRRGWVSLDRSPPEWRLMVTRKGLKAMEGNR